MTTILLNNWEMWTSVCGDIMLHVFKYLPAWLDSHGYQIHKLTLFVWE
jgi:hypothetical protein